MRYQMPDLFRAFANLPTRCMLASLLLVVCLPAANAQQAVIWASTSAPEQPVYEQFTNIQLGFDVQRLIFAQLPGYQIQYRPQNSARAFQEMQREANVCTGTKLRTDERDNTALVSELPQVLLEGLRLMVRQHDPLFAEVESAVIVNLVSFIQRYPSAILGYVAGRSYGNTLDKQLQLLQEQGRVYQLSAERGSIGAIDMLAKGKVDIILDFPVLTEHYFSQQGEQMMLHALKLAGEPAYANGHIYCSNSAFGQQFMQHLDQAMRTVVAQRSYLDAHLAHISPERQPAFIDYYNHVYQTRF
jgi:uncharacterized protein (TIGR02285 family)